MALSNIPIYNLESFIDLYWEMDKDIHIVNKYNFQEKLSLYKNVLKELPYDMYINPNAQHYRREIHINDSYYTIVWNIDLLDKIVKTMHLSPILFRTCDLIETIDDDAIEEIKLSKTTNNPIYVAAVPFISDFAFVIDGNHRVVKNFRQGEDIISGYFLLPDVFIEAIPSKFIQMVVKIHYNIWLMYQYIVGSANINEFQRSLFEL